MKSPAAPCPQARSEWYYQGRRAGVAHTADRMLHVLSLSQSDSAKLEMIRKIAENIESIMWRERA